MGANDVARGTGFRRIPSVGDEVCIVHLAALEAATVLQVHDGGRRVIVQGHTAEEALEFVLSPTTARFVSGGSYGPRLRWPRGEETAGPAAGRVEQ